MFQRTVCILTVDIKEHNPCVQFLITKLKGLLWQTRQANVLHQDSTILATEIEKSIKRNQISILVGVYTNEIASSLSKVFHQNLKSMDLGQVPIFARFLDPPFDTVFYIQGLIFIPLTSNVYTTFENVVEPFLSSIATLNHKSIIPLDILNGDHTYESTNVFYEFSRYEHVRKSIVDIEKCLSQYHPDNIFISFNGGKDCTVLLHITLAVLKRYYPQYSKKQLCLYIQNVDSFQEINDFVMECENYYKLQIVKITKDTREALADILYVHPHLKACLMGTRRTDPFSEHLNVFQMTDPDWPQVMRVCPLLDWHYSEIWDYLLTLKVPYCKLYDMGYTSLGNVNNTVKNPSLHFIENSTATYLPAYKLLDAAQERQGRK